MNIEDLQTTMEELEGPYSKELFTTWEQGFFEDIQERLADVEYRFSEKQLDRIEAMREKYDLDIRHGEATR